MLTYEQIDNIKEGDTLLLAVIMEKKINHCTFKVKTSNDSCVAASTIRLSLPSEHGTSVPTPKHAPCRLFKEGDKVRVVEWNGRKVHDPINGAVWTVNRNERDGGIAHESILVSLFYEDDKEGHIIDIPPCFVELVTPVEEIEPYSVVDAHTHWEVADKHMKIVSTYSKLHHPNPKAAAEAERDRLNAEYRKEQK